MVNKINMSKKELNNIIDKLTVVDLKTRALKDKIEKSYLKKIRCKKKININIKILYFQLLDLITLRENYISLIVNIKELEANSQMQIC